MTPPRPRPARRAASLLLALAVLLVGAPAAGARAQEPAADSAAQQHPDSIAARTARRAQRARESALFATDSVLRLTLVTDLRALGDQKDTLRPRTFPGIVYVGRAGGTVALPVGVQARGHYRLRNCGFPPLRLAFDSTAAGTVFDRQSSLKLVTHCRENSAKYEEYVAREYLAYRAHGLLQDSLAYRVRLARVRYVNARDPNRADTTRAEEHWAFFLEPDRLVAARLGGREVEQRGALFENIVPDSATSLALFQYFVGNSDWSLAALHNVRLVSRPDGDVYAVAYDLDFSGLVNTDYAVPDPRLPIRTVRQRLWRGPCTSPASLTAAFATYTERRARLEALWREPIPGSPPGVAWVSDDYVRETQRWVGEFYAAVGNAGEFLKRARRDTDGCKTSN